MRVWKIYCEAFLYNKHVVYKTGRKAVKRDGRNKLDNLMSMI